MSCINVMQRGLLVAAGVTSRSRGPDPMQQGFPLPYIPCLLVQRLLACVDLDDAPARAGASRWCAGAAGSCVPCCTVLCILA